jgi:predicted ribosome quality control (RQC) complex YloA/Tae2 family protein
MSEQSHMANNEIPESRLAAEKNALHLQLAHKLQKIQRQIHHQQRALEECRDWQRLFHDAELLQAHFHLWKPGTQTLQVNDWEMEGEQRLLEINPRIALADQIKESFNRCRRLRGGIAKLQKAINHSLAIAEQLQQMDIALEAVDELGTLQTFKKQLARSPQEKHPSSSKALPYREYWSSTGLRIMVGKRDADNEKLTFKIAHGNDWWLHVDGYPGSHVVLKAPPSGAPPDNESLKDAQLLALWHSKARQHTSANIAIVQCKYVRPLKRGKAGQVQIAHHRLLPIVFDSDRLAQLQQRKPKDPCDH